jgi:predicted secreted protein
MKPQSDFADRAASDGCCVSPCSASDLFSDDEIKLLRQAGSIGDMETARTIVESKGLTWMDSLVEKTQIQQHNV